MIPKTIINNDKGIILLMVLLVIFVVVALANVILMQITSQSRLTHHQVSRIQAYYAAQAGMNYALENLRNGNTGNFSLCNSAACTYNDPDIPYRVDVTIGAPGSGISGTRRIDIRATYTYTP